MNSPLMLKATSELIDQAQSELLIRGDSHLKLAEELEIAIQLVDNFFAGEIVDIHTYNLICNYLGIEPPSAEIGNRIVSNDISLDNLNEESDVVNNMLNQDNHGDYEDLEIEFAQDHDLSLAYLDDQDQKC